MAMLRNVLPAELVEVTSAGVQISPGMPVPARHLQLARQLGIEGLEEHRAQPLNADDLEDYDLILGMSRNHRRYIVQKDPRLVRKTFTLREFAHLAPYVGKEDIRRSLDKGESLCQAVVEAITMKRGMVPKLPSKDDLDIIDPYNKSRRIHRRSRDQLVPAVEAAADYLNGAIEVLRTLIAEQKPQPILTSETFSPEEPSTLDELTKRATDTGTIPVIDDRMRSAHEAAFARLRGAGSQKLPSRQSLHATPTRGTR